MIMKDCKLAIVIPAYKNDFLLETLKSLSSQTDKRFNVYIGDDASPFNLYSIVKEFEKDLAIDYRYFPENLGGNNLVAQWNRCLDLIKNEEFFILFSDDDIMSPRCVEDFYKTIEANNVYDVYHFDIDIIDNNGRLKTRCPQYPRVLSSFTFFSLLYNHKKIDARMPEFLFRTEYFRQVGGFVEFDLAYRTDNATVMRCAQKRGIYTIPDSKVLWRESGINVSSTKHVSSTFLYKKCKAAIDFFNWVDEFLKEESKSWPISIFRRSRIVIKNLLPVYKALGKDKSMELLRRLFEVRNSNITFQYYYFMLIIRVILKIKR